MTSSAMLSIFMLLRGTLGKNHDHGDKPPTQLNLVLITPNKGVKDEQMKEQGKDDHN